MKIGDIVTSYALFSEEPCKRRETVSGRCVYIHPQRRFYVAEFDIGGRKLREAYYFQTRKGDFNENHISDKSQGRRR